MSVTIGFEDMTFKPHDEGLRAFFYQRYYFDIPRDELDALGPWQLKDGDIVFEDISEKKAWNKMTWIVEAGLQKLTHLLYNKPTIFINEVSGIPLIGSNEFGVIDRGSNILEIKPVTGCNFTCVYCSVDEGKNNKTHDYVVEADYIVKTVAWIAPRKEHPIECNIGPQGEPLLYPKLIELIEGLSSIPQVESISMNTNGSMLSEALIDKLANAGLTRINLSLNAVEQEAANKLAGTAYPLERVKKMVAYCQEKAEPKIAVMLAPTYVPGYNDDQIEPLVQLSNKIINKNKYPAIGVQNFLNYPKGRNPATQRPWEEFYKMLEEIGERTGTSLKFSMEQCNIFHEPELPKPWKKGQTIRARIMLPGRYPREMLGVAGQGHEARCITIVNARPEHKIGKEVKVKLVRDKHNIYKGTI